MPLTSHPQALQPGVVLGDRFVVGEPIGAGAMGAVYRVEDKNTGAPAAVKVLHERLIGSREYVSRFKREALAASRFRHEAAVRVLGSGTTDDGVPYIVMELVEGQSLKEILEEKGALSVGRACNIAHQLARALGAAHRRGIVHRDMKPDNVRVMVDEDGIERPKILDFGVVKFIGGDPGELEGAVKTKTGIVLGTPKYMAPEQVRGEAVDGRADVYALGAMLYEMLAGEPPFVADDVFGFVAMHLKQAVIPLSQRVPERDIPAGLDEIVLHMLEKVPSDRPSDTAELADRIERWAVEDPRAAEKDHSLRIGMAAVVGAGILAAVAIPFVAPGAGVAGSAAALGLGAGAAGAARMVPRPSVTGYARRMLVVIASVSAVGSGALLLPSSPGGFVVAAHGLAALLSYAAYLIVWSSPTRRLRFVAAGIVAPVIAAPLLPVRVVPEGDGTPFFVTLISGAAQGLETAVAAARQSALLGLVVVAVLFAAAALALPKPAAARI